MAQVTAKSSARNSVYALVAQVWRIASRFLLTPLIIAKLGLEGYGVWMLELWFRLFCDHPEIT